ncbi:hypothetical protein CUT44_18090 [Streptomyces carminius]|uniref:Uncharacterized protein n=1 Tax=Streptomyces carminius TaxID=2665496 RepID=A0A2M8LWT0_9ACTN|nr:hypothetical protein [Streptomyces carminius]PJE96416.1 hypothetical protein CUT44_18090 [Streptomyces carminius]
MSILTSDFGKPIGVGEAEAIREDHTGNEPVTAQANEWDLGCGNGVAFIDSNGTFNVQYYCGSTCTLSWGFELSAASQNTVVGDINETGPRRWRNGSFAGQSARHSVPPNYQIHGTLKPVYDKIRIKYQDYIIRRHNIGPGGTASPTFAGRLNLTN